MNTYYTVVLVNPSIDPAFKSPAYLKGKFITDAERPFNKVYDKETARTKAIAANKHIPKNEKKFLGLKYRVAELTEEFVFTGK